MKGLAVHSLTREQLQAFISAPSHALMLVGPTGSGKGVLAASLAETVLELPTGKLADHPYALIIAPGADDKSIGIDTVRQLEQFLSLKVPGKTAHDRVVIIEDAQLLTLEAQNALLKLLEEPPDGTVLILTVDHERAMLPTIRSRALAIPVGRLGRPALERHFADQGFKSSDIQQAYAVSAGLPGLMTALLNESDHPLAQATERARELLSQSAYERLTMVDELSKQRQLAIDICSILQQMAHVSLQTAAGPAARKWQAVLQASYETGAALAANAQPKLALTKLMLAL